MFVIEIKRDNEWRPLTTIQQDDTLRTEAAAKLAAEKMMQKWQTNYFIPRGENVSLRVTSK
jgi:hypothetical protein